MRFGLTRCQDGTSLARYAKLPTLCKSVSLLQTLVTCRRKDRNHQRHYVNAKTETTKGTKDTKEYKSTKMKFDARTFGSLVNTLLACSFNTR